MAAATNTPVSSTRDIVNAISHPGRRNGLANHSTRTKTGGQATRGVSQEIELAIGRTVWEEAVFIVLPLPHSPATNTRHSAATVPVGVQVA